MYSDITRCQPGSYAPHSGNVFMNKEFKSLERKVQRDMAASPVLAGFTVTSN